MHIPARHYMYVGCLASPIQKLDSKIGRAAAVGIRDMLQGQRRFRMDERQLEQTECPDNVTGGMRVLNAPRGASTEETPRPLRRDWPAGRRPTRRPRETRPAFVERGRPKRPTRRATI